MATDKKDDQSRTSRPPRKPVTIDLDAKDVKETTAKKAEGESKAAEASPKAEPAKADSAKGGPATTEPAKSTAATSGAASGAKDAGAQPDATKARTEARPGDAKAAPASGAETPKPGSASDAKTATSAPGKPAEPAAKTASSPDKASSSQKPAASPDKIASSEKAEAKPARRGGIVGWFAAALVGGAVALGGGYGLQMAGILPAPASDAASTADLAGQGDKIAALEAKLDAFIKEAPAAGASADAVAALEQKVDALAAGLDDQTNAGRSIAGRLDALEGKTTAAADLADQVAELRRLVSTGSQGPEVALQSLQAEIADLRAEVKAVAAPAAADAGLSDAVDALSKRLDTIEATVRDLNPGAAIETALAPVDERLKALDAAAGERQAAVAAVTASADQTARTVGTVQESLTALTGRLEGVEKAVGGPGARETAARAVAVSALATAVDAGRPYGVELAAVKSTLGDAVNLGPLQAHAGTGIVPKTALIKQFPGIEEKALATLAAPAAGSGFLDRLMSNAESVVTVKTSGDATGTGIRAVLARMRVRVAAGDLVGALQQWDMVAAGDETKAAVAIVTPWVDAVRARLAADGLMQSVTGEVLSLLADQDQAGAQGQSSDQGN